jgi:hypothetical protein
VGWRDLVTAPKPGDHFVQVYRDPAFLARAVAEFLSAALQANEAVVLIARPEHAELFRAELASRGLNAGAAQAAGQLKILDAQDSLDLFMRDGMPDWPLFEREIGGVIAALRPRFPAVRAYGEMVDILWQDGQRDAAIRLEEYWNDLGRQESFSLFCAYYMDNLDPGSYGGALECICRVHTQLIPAEDYAWFDAAVAKASERVLGRPLAGILFELVEGRRRDVKMPLGQEALFWLHKRMPLTAEKVLAEVRAGAQAG